MSSENEKRGGVSSSSTTVSLPSSVAHWIPCSMRCKVVVASIRFLVTDTMLSSWKSTLVNTLVRSEAGSSANSLCDFDDDCDAAAAVAADLEMLFVMAADGWEDLDDFFSSAALIQSKTVWHCFLSSSSGPGSQQ